MNLNNTDNRNSNTGKRLVQAVKCLLVVFALVFTFSGCGKPADGILGADKQNSNVTSSTEREETNPSSDPTVLPAQEIAPSDVDGDSASSLSPTQNSEAEIPADDDIIRILDYIQPIYVDLKYATTDNFTGTVIYDFADATLRYGTVKKLLAVQEELAEQGYSLKIWDAYRPVSAQFKLWEVYPDPTYVANPNNGFSSHSKGNTVDVTLVLLDGSDVEMPSKFDDFSSFADCDYSDVTINAANNALLLEEIMKRNGFSGYSGEWWHYSDTTDYPVVDS